MLAYDADEAGQAAAERVYEWERRHEIEVAVLALPAGTDPDELARVDPEALPRAVRDAQPFLGFRVDRVLRPANLATPEGRARAADGGPRRGRASTRARSSATSTSWRSPTRAGSRRTSCASSCASRDARRWSRRRRTPWPTRADVAPERARIRSGAEIEALRMLVQRPTELAADLGPWLFTEGPVRRAYEALAETGSLHEAIDESDPVVPTSCAGCRSRRAPRRRRMS